MEGSRETGRREDGGTTGTVWLRRVWVLLEKCLFQLIVTVLPMSKLHWGYGKGWLSSERGWRGCRGRCGFNLLRRVPSAKEKGWCIICLFQPRKLGQVSPPKCFPSPATERSQLGRFMRLYSTASIYKPDLWNFPWSVFLHCASRGALCGQACVWRDLLPVIFLGHRFKIAQLYI